MANEKKGREVRYSDIFYLRPPEEPKQPKVSALDRLAEENRAKQEAKAREGQERQAKLDAHLRSESNEKKRKEQQEREKAEEERIKAAKAAAEEKKAQEEKESVNTTATTFIALDDALESTIQSMARNPLYEENSNKLKLVRLLQDALQEVTRTSQQALVRYEAKGFEAEYKKQCIHSITLAHLIISHDTKTSRTAQLGKAIGTFLGEKPAEPTEIREFYRATFQFPQGYVKAKTNESFRSLSDKVKQAEKSGVGGKTVFMDLIMPGLVQRLENAQQLFPDAAQMQDQSAAAVAPPPRSPRGLSVVSEITAAEQVARQQQEQQVPQGPY